MPLAIDASTPAVVTNSNNSTATITTASFTPPTGSLLLIRWAGNSVGGANPSTPTITDNLGAHLTYTLLDWQSRANSPTVDGQAAMWWAVVGTSAAMTVTVTSGAAAGGRVAAMHVTVITGQHATPIGAHSKSGSASTSSIAQNYTGTATSSQGFLVVNDWTDTGAETAGTGCTLTNGGSASIPGQISYAFMRRTSADGTNGGTTTLNSTLPGTSTALSWTYAEVIPAGGSLSVTPTGITSSEAIGSPSITTTYSVTASGIPSGEVVGNPTIQLVTSIQASGIPSSERVGSPTISTTVTVSPSGIASSERVGQPTITLTVTASGIPSSERVGSPTIQVVVAVNATGIPSSEAVGSPTISTTVGVSPSGIPSSERVGSPTVTVASVTVFASGIPSSERFGSPTVTTGSVTVTASGIVSSERFGSPQVSLGSLALSITASGIPSSERFGSPYIGHEITPDITVEVFTEVLIWRADTDVASTVAIETLIDRADPTLVNVDSSDLVVEP